MHIHDRSPPPKGSWADANELFAEAERLLAAGSLSDALAGYEYLARHFPPHPAVLRRLGEILARSNRNEEAVRFLARSLKLDPHSADTWVEQGLALRELGRAQEAFAKMERAVNEDPANARAWRFKGASEMELGRYGDAAASWARALEADPAFARALVDRAIMRGDLGDIDAAIADLDAALAIDPADRRALAIKGEHLLLAGDYSAGWAAFEARFGTEFRTKLDREQIIALPRWTGVEPLQGRTILVHPEVGFGDFLMFSRYVPLLDQLGAHVIIYCPPTLSALMASAFPEATVAGIGQQIPAFDFQCPVMSLPLAFRTSLATIPSRVPYLRVSERKREEWSRRIGSRRGRRIGLAWANQPRAIDRSPLRRRGMTLGDIEPLLALPFEFHVLQKDIAPAEADALRGRPRVHLHDFAINDFEDTAAIAAHMDIVVTIDTSIAHLAGALGLHTLVMLPPACDFRWTRNGDSTPWYPNAMLFRRTLTGTWREPVETIRNYLASQSPLVPA